MHKPFLSFLILLLYCLSGQAQTKFLPILGTKRYSGPKTYTITFDDKGKIKPSVENQALPAILRVDDVIEYGLPQDDFKTKFPQELDTFKVHFVNNYPLLSCQYPVLEYLICKDETSACLSETADLLKRIVCKQPDSFSIDTTNPFKINNTDDISYEFRKRQSKNILIDTWLKKTVGTYRGFNISGCSFDKNCLCNANLCLPCKDGTCDCDAQKTEAKFWTLFYQLSSAYTSLKVEYNTLLYEADTIRGDTKRINIAIEQAEKINIDLSQLVSQVINANKGWMISWLWYTNGIPALNPFGTSDTTSQSTYLRSRIATLAADVGAYEQTGAREGALGIRRSQGMVIQLARELTLLKTRLAQLPALDKAYKKKIDELSVESELLYQGELYVSNIKKVIWMPMFDAATKYKNVVEKKYPDQISELDEMRPLVINLEAKKEVTLEEDVKQIENISQFERTVGSALKQLTTEVESFDKLKPLTVLPNIVRQPVATQSATLTAILNALNNELNQIETTLLLADWLFQQTAPPAKIKFKDEEDDKPAFRTEWVKPTEPKAKNGSVAVTYGITEKTDKIDKIVVRNETYTQYELTRVVPAAGIVYHFGNRYASEFKDGSFSDQPFNRVDYLFGIKIYPFRKTDVQYKTKTAQYYYQLGKKYNYRRGNNLANRINLFVGLGTEKIFRNYYLGVGLDVTPFLQIQAGGNWYIQKRYELKNGTIINSQDHLTNGDWYLSATLPVGVVASALKFINPF